MTASVQMLFVGTQGQTPTDRVPAAPVQSGLSAILRHRKEVHGLQPHRHFPHLTTDSFDRRRLHKWKLLGLTLLFLAVSILRRLRQQHDPAGREISAPKTWPYDVEVNCGRLVSCRLRSLVFFFSYTTAFDFGRVRARNSRSRHHRSARALGGYFICLLTLRLRLLISMF